MKNLLRRALSLALVSIAMPAAAQSVGSSVVFPSGWAPGQAPCIKQVDGTCVPVSAANPLPVAGRSTTSGTSDSAAMPVQGVTGGVPQNVQGPSSSGAAVSGNPLRMGYSDGTTTRDVLGSTDGSPYFQIRGTGNTVGIATVGNAATAMVTSAQTLRVSAAGQL